MNANALQRGHDYAYVEFPSRGRNYYGGAKRVRVLFVYKLEPIYGRKKVSLVEGQRLTDDGLPHPDFPEPITISARQIYTDWAEHLIEKQRHDEKQAEQNRKWEQQRQERLERDRVQREKWEKEEEERKKTENARRERIYLAFESAGIARTFVSIGHDVSIRISNWQMEGVIENIERKSIIRAGDSERIDEGEQATTT
jgi:hypothetical protein